MASLPGLGLRTTTTCQCHCSVACGRTLPAAQPMHNIRPCATEAPHRAHVRLRSQQLPPTAGHTTPLQQHGPAAVCSAAAGRGSGRSSCTQDNGSCSSSSELSSSDIVSSRNSGSIVSSRNGHSSNAQQPTAAWHGQSMPSSRKSRGSQSTRNGNGSAAGSSNSGSSSSSSSSGAWCVDQQLTGAAIMQQLKAARDWQQLQQLVDQHSQQLNWRHSSALVTHLAQLQAQQQLQLQQQAPQQGELVQQQQQQQLQGQHHVAEHMRNTKEQQQQQAAAFEPLVNAQAAAAAAAASQASFPSSSGCDMGLPQFIQQAVVPLIDSHLQQYDARGLANILWALARLQQSQAAVGAAAAPSQQWLMRFCSTSQPLLPQFDPQHLSNTLWGLVQLQHTPPEPWMQAWHAAMSHRLAAAAAAPAGNHGSAAAVGAGMELQALSSALWSLAQLTSSSSSLPTSCVDQLLLVAADKLLADTRSSNNSSSAQAVSNLLWSCAQLQHQPQLPVLQAVRDWLQHVAAAAAAGQQQLLGNQAVANMLWALAKLQQQQQLVGSSSSTEDHSSDQARRDSGSSCSTSAAAADSTRSRSRKQASSTSSQGGGSNSSRQSGSSDSSSSDSYKSVDSTPAAVLQQCGQLLYRLSYHNISSCSWRHLSNIVWAAGVLQLQPNSLWLSRFHQLLQLQHQAGMSMQEGLTGQHPAAAAEASSGLTVLTDQQVANLLWGLSQLKALQHQQQPSRNPWHINTGILEQLLLAQQSRLPGYTSVALSSSLLSAARMGLKIPEQLLQAWLQEVARRNYLSAAGTRAMTDSCCALALIRRNEEEAAAAAAASARASSSSSSAVRLVAGRKVSFRPRFDADWLTGFCAASGPRLASFSGDQLAGVGWSLAALQFKPPMPWLLGWQAAVADAAGSMSAEAAAKAFWALSHLTPGPTGAGKEAAASSLVAAAVAAAAAGLADAHSLAVTASCIAAVASGSGDSSKRAAASNALQQLLQALPRLLSSCSGQQMSMLLSAAAKLQVPLQQELLDAALQHVQRLAEQRQLGNRDTASIMAAVAKLVAVGETAAVADAAAAAPASQHNQQRQELEQQSGREQQWRPPRQWRTLRRSDKWLSSMLQSFAMRTATASELSQLLWALAVLDCHPGSTWLNNWLQSSYRQLQSFTPSHLASCGWALTALNHRPGPTWRLAWVQAVEEQAAAAQSAELALMVYAAAALGCEVEQSWLLSVATMAARNIRRWSVRDMSMGCWGLAQLGLRAVADWELLEVLMGEMMSATAAGGMESLNPYQQLQLLQTLVVLRQPVAAEWVAAAVKGRDPDVDFDAIEPLAATTPAWQRHRRQQLAVSRRTVVKVRWRAKMAAKQVDAVAAAAAVAQQQRLWVQGLQQSTSSSTASAAASARYFASAIDAAAAHAATAAASALAVTTGRTPDSVGLPVDRSWLLLWCKATLPQLHRWRPSVAAGALSAFAALGVQPPSAWQQRVLQQVLQQRRHMSWHDADTIAHALGLLQSPFCKQWAKQLRATYSPAAGTAAAATQPGVVNRQQRQRKHLHFPWQKSVPGAVTGPQAVTARYPQLLSTHELLQLRRQQRSVRLMNWWRRLQAQQQQQRQQQQAQLAAAAEAAWADWRPGAQQLQQRGVNGYAQYQRAGSSSSSGRSSLFGSPASSLDGSPVLYNSSSGSSNSNSSSTSSRSSGGSQVVPSQEGRKLGSSWQAGGLKLAQRPVHHSSSSSSSASASTDDAGANAGAAAAGDSGSGSSQSSNSENSSSTAAAASSSDSSSGNTIEGRVPATGASQASVVAESCAVVNRDAAVVEAVRNSFSAASAAIAASGVPSAGTQVATDSPAVQDFYGGSSSGLPTQQPLLSWIWQAD